MYRSRSASQSNRRRKRTPKKQQQSVVGNLLLELIALAAFWGIISVSKFEGSVAHHRQDASAQSTTEFGALLAGLLTDQLERYRLLPDR